MYGLKLLILLLLRVNHEADTAPGRRKFMYQKDMSEYCKRRVKPSVFLGRQVVSAYSHALQFSRLEMPYSCFVSVRTESGSNIILVIQLMSASNLINSCQENKNQLLVYEIGETFGGYWGQLPENMWKKEHKVSPDLDLYTLKKTESTTTYSVPSTTEEATTTTATTKSNETFTAGFNQRKDYITVEVPILNVSVHLEPGEPVQTKIVDVFDPVTDGTWPDESYSSTMLSLVQFSVEDGVDVQRTGGTIYDYKPRFEIEFNSDGFTLDPRLLLLLSPNDKRLGKLDTKYKYSANSLLNFKKHKHFTQDDSFNKRVLPLSFRTQSIAPSLFTKFYDYLTTPMRNMVENDPSSWHVINDILKKLNKTNDRTTPNELANLLRGLSKIDTSQSKVFIDPNSSWYTYRPTSLKTRSEHTTSGYHTDSITWSVPSAAYQTNYLDEYDPTTVEVLSPIDNKSSNTTLRTNINDTIINNDGVLLPLALDINTAVLNASDRNIIKDVINPSMLVSEVNGTTITTTPTVMKPLTLLDHESFENMVHAASLMAVALNQSSPTPRVDDLQVQMVTPANTTIVSRRRMKRKKRYIHAVPIEDSKPHHLPVKPEVTTTEHGDHIADVQEFQHHIELQDDELYDRVSLRHIHRFVGPVLFNICDFDEAATKFVYLFNSSRLVIVLNNFTLDRMTIVMTPARTMLKSQGSCGDAHLECQVSGARVCIDSLGACDGVPNCGSYDIYDEDRLMCGATAGLHHNACLAAITFLAVLLTILYIVHYWLKRCVPKVSDAFFIYTDDAENVLYLDTIMRSPHDPDDGKYYYRGKCMLDYMGEEVQVKKSRVSKFFRKLFKKFRRKRRPTHNVDIIDEFDHMQPGMAPRLYSFADLELNKMSFAVDVAIQTGPSLEMGEIDVPIRKNQEVIDDDTELSDIIAYYEGRRRSTDLRLEKTPSEVSELSLLKFLKTSRSMSMQESMKMTFSEDNFYRPEVASKATSNEKEIQTHSFDDVDDLDPGLPSSDQTVTSVLISEKKQEVQKRLRFEEEPTQMDRDDDDGIEETSGTHRRSLASSRNNNNRNDDVEILSDAEEPGPSNQKEQKSYFWSTNKSKGKKAKKKQISTLKH